MKASELRIGNSIMQDDELVFITWWRLEFIEKNILEYKPIPLTKEWLLKLGFDKLKEYDDGENIITQYGKSIIVGDDTHDEKIVISFPFNHCEIGDYSDDSAYILNIDITYVHQLQNLYFALTGEELTYKSE